jgi:hypothetical protein
MRRTAVGLVSALLLAPVAPAPADVIPPGGTGATGSWDGDGARPWPPDGTLVASQVLPFAAEYTSQGKSAGAWVRGSIFNAVYRRADGGLTFGVDVETSERPGGFEGSRLTFTDFGGAVVDVMDVTYVGVMYETARRSPDGSVLEVVSGHECGCIDPPTLRFDTDAVDFNRGGTMVWNTYDEFMFWADAAVNQVGLFQPLPEPTGPLALLLAASVAMRRRR